METFFFYLFGGVSIAMALVVVVSRRPAYGALALIVCFCSLAGLYGLLGASLLAAVQIIVYAGAILVLFLLVIMLLNVRGESPYTERRGFLGWAAALAGVLMAVELVVVVTRSQPAVSSASGPSGTAAELGRYLFSDYLLPFEATAVLFLAALVGATWLARR